MGDRSELSTIIIIGTFITLLVAMIALMPADFFYPTETEAAIQFESGFDVRGLLSYNQTEELAQSDMETLNFPGIGTTRYEDWGKDEFGHNMRWHLKELGVDSFTFNQHGYTLFDLGTLWTGGHNQEWITEAGISRGSFIFVSDLEADYDGAINATRYKVRCEHFYWEAAFTYNVTAFSGFADAIDNDGLFLVAGFDWDQIGTTYNAWGIISGVLLFDLPGDLESNVWVYVIVSVPLWLAALYVSFILILRAIGAVFGGGGS